MIEITSVFQYSHPGKVREMNEDAIHADPEHAFWILADGVGGHVGGEIASQLVISSISETLQEHVLNESIEKACNDIARAQSEHADYANMGTTLVIAHRQKRAFNIAWVGDSRLYCYDESLRLLTHDHSFVQELIDRGVLTKPQARRHEKRNLITNFIGLQGERATVAYKQFKPVKSGTLLLCSDGVTDYVTEGQLAIIMASTSDNEARAEQLVSCVFDTPAADNLSFIFVSYNVSLGLKLLNRVT